MSDAYEAPTITVLGEVTDLTQAKVHHHFDAGHRGHEEGTVS
jgi:hypothetical protein